ncbi:MAG: hypothetical protein HFJ65_08005 [Eggerthellaceae bacterium]|nr:hypothetical protein [Eggerthellaceae bacterium]
MADKTILHKIIQLQERVIAEMKPLEEKDVLPTKLVHAKEKAVDWANAVDKKEGNDKSYREWPPKQFAHELKANINLFGNHEGTQLIREYEQAVAKMPYDADHEHV